MAERNNGSSNVCRNLNRRKQLHQLRNSSDIHYVLWYNIVINLAINVTKKKMVASRNNGVFLSTFPLANIYHNIWIFSF